MYLKIQGLERVLHVPVDVCPERFRILLDWYRYEELYVPSMVPIDAVLRDAARGGLECL